jgi:hypothetical protein
MNWDAVSAIAEILSSVGVIASLVYLAIQLRQNNELMSAEARQSRTESSESAFRAMAENADLAEIFVKARQGQKLSAVEGQRFMAYWMALLVNLQATFRELRPEELESVLNRYRTYQAALPELNAVWSQVRTNLVPAFVELMDTNVFERRE